MRLLKIGVYYPAYLKHFYAQRPGLAAQPYAAQHAPLIDDCFGSSDFWTKALSESGYETCDLVANAEPMQKEWAAEHGLAFEEGNWLFEITAAQVRDFRPDALIVADYSTVTAAFLNHLRAICPSLRLVLGWCGAPYRDGSIFGACDVVLSCVPELVAHFREQGHRSRHVNHAFEPRILTKLDTTAAPSADFAFLGSIIKSEQFHLEREKILSRLVEETNLQIWSDVGPPPLLRQEGDAPESGSAGSVGRATVRAGVRLRVSSIPILGGVARRASRILRGGSQTHAPAPSMDERIARRARPSLFGLEMFQQLRDSRVALNTHIDISPTSASNMRLFEATGVGTCLLTDWKDNLPELFEPDAEVVAYRDAAECVEKVKYLLEHEPVRRRVAAAGQRRTLRDHTFESRAAQIDAIIHETLSNT
ncbi:MAG: glycosyltransferase [Acidobacteria bacterium]|nr:glycosyltransferase [Acidobacteriota bacterium]